MKPNVRAQSESQLNHLFLHNAGSPCTDIELQPTVNVKTTKALQTGCVHIGLMSEKRLAAGQRRSLSALKRKITGLAAEWGDTGLQEVALRVGEKMK